MSNPELHQVTACSVRATYTCSAVRPLLLFEDVEAPLASKCFTASNWPFEHALKSGVLTTQQFALAVLVAREPRTGGNEHTDAPPIIVRCIDVQVHVHHLLQRLNHVDLPVFCRMVHSPARRNRLLETGASQAWCSRYVRPSHAVPSVWIASSRNEFLNLTRSTHTQQQGPVNEQQCKDKQGAGTHSTWPRPAAFSSFLQQMR